MKYIFLAIITLFTNLFFGLYASSENESKFLEGMSMHHESAVKMSEMALKKTKNKNIVELARIIKKDQNKEIKKLKNWNSKWYGASEVVEVKKDKHGMMNMADLQNKSGKEFDKAFLEMMTKHHQEGIQMANKMMPELERKEIHHFAKEMIEKQSKEVVKMEEIKKTL